MVEYVYKDFYVYEYNFNTAADEKPGECPVVNRAALSCPRQELRSHKCSGDGSCPRVLKCCYNGCFSDCIIPGI